MPNLKDRALAPRPRAALEAILATTSSTLELGLNATLDELEQQLFKLAEQAHSNDAQNRCFESLREVRRGRVDVAPRFMLRLEAALATITDEPVSPEFMRVSRGGKAQLALIDPLELEQALALQELASKAEIRNASALFLLGQRFGVLAGMPAFDADKLPVGPHRLCECLAEAVRGLDLQFEHRMLLFRMFDRQSMPVLSGLYDQLNALCVRERVLPNLQVHAVFKRMPNAQPGDAATTSAAAPRPAKAEAADPGFLLGGTAEPASHAPRHGTTGPGAAAPRDAPRGAAERPQAARTFTPPTPPSHAPAPQAAQPHAAAPAGERPPAETGPMANPMLGWPGTPPPYQPERRAPAPARPDPLELELFDTLRDLLSGRRHAMGA
ncbi:MAG TPA: DUF1631 family protein, partial [Xanthomonadales bacterium]|nr:DUF1631 family protein [Xanthomonadales bacterium]